jgi:glucuronokinase
MDFARDLMERQGHGHYQELDAETLPRLYIAYRADLAEGSEVQHAGFRDKYLQGDPAFHEAVAYWADLTDTVRGRLESGKGNTISDLLDANFDRRAEVCSVSLGNRRMIEAARAAGASAKFTGSGGAIIGTYENEAIFQELRSTLEPLQIHVFKPVIAPPVSDGGAEGCGLEI